jgi:Fe-S-cluster containining protein
MAAFACTGCGACCKVAPRVHPEWPKRADGACAHLTQDNRCDIYESRPLICRVDAMRPASVAVEDWHTLTAIACADLLKRAG